MSEEEEEEAEAEEEAGKEKVNVLCLEVSVRLGWRGGRGGEG